jgi:hypothetical protein
MMQHISSRKLSATFSTSKNHKQPLLKKSTCPESNWVSHSVHHRQHAFRQTAAAESLAATGRRARPKCFVGKTNNKNSIAM